MKNKILQAFLLLSTLAYVAFDSSAYASKEMRELFTIASDSTFPWFESDDTTRGMTYNPKGSLLVADRIPEETVYLLDPQTGLETGRLNTSYLQGGIYRVNKLAASQDGRIILTNLAVPSEEASLSSTFRVYYYYKENSDPVVIFEDQNVQSRWGDDIAVHGVGARMKIAITGSDNEEIMFLSDPDSDGTFTAEYLQPTNPSLVGTNNISFDLDANSFWTRQSSGEQTTTNHYSLRGGLGTGRKTGVGAALGPIDMVMLDGSAMLGIGPGLARTTFTQRIHRGSIIDIDRASFPKWQTTNLAHPDGLKDNINGAGDVCIDEANRRVYFLFTNNTISGWQIPYE